MIIIMLVICVIMTFPLFYFEKLSEKIKNIIIIMMYLVPVMYALLFFLDPGTLFED